MSRSSTLSLVGGAVCLDFANTASGRGTALRQEHLPSFGHLLLWSEHAGLISPADRQRLSRLAARSPAAAAAVLRRALALREAIHAVGAALTRGVPPPAPSLVLINRELAAVMSQARLRRGDDGFSWDWANAPMRFDRALWPIARSLAELLLAPLHKRIKQCPGHGCGWLFLDTTKNRSRRWCEMSVCGTRAKIRRYRARQGKFNRKGAKT